MADKRDTEEQSIQPPPDHRGVTENGPFNPPIEHIQPTRGRRGGLAYIVTTTHPDGTITRKRTDES